MKICSNESPKSPKLKDDEILSPFLEYLEPACINLKPGDTLVVYRTQDQIPVDDYGEAPRPRRRFGEAAIRQKLTSQEVKSLSPKKREKNNG